MAIEARTKESDAGIRVGGMQDQGHRKTGMNPDAGQDGLVAKRGLLADVHTPRPTRSLADCPGGTRPTTCDIHNAAVSPSVGDETFSRAYHWSALSPDKYPCIEGSLPVLANISNSRFFTNCYLHPAAIVPRLRRMSGFASLNKAVELIPPMFQFLFHNKS
jgi:hypothetical protein